MLIERNARIKHLEQKVSHLKFELQAEQMRSAKAKLNSIPEESLARDSSTQTE